MDRERLLGFLMEEREKEMEMQRLRQMRFKMPEKTKEKGSTKRKEHRIEEEIVGDFQVHVCDHLPKKHCLLHSPFQ